MNCTLRKLMMAMVAVAALVPVRARAADDKAADKSTAAASSDTGSEGGGEEDKGAAKNNNNPHTLEDRIRPVSGSLFVRKGRTEITPNVNVSVNDAFFQKYMFGLKLDYHVSDSIAIGLAGSFGISSPSGTVNVCNAQGCQTPSKDDLINTPGNVTLLAGLNLAWSPLYGKINIAGEKVLHFDTFFVAGLDGVQYANPSTGDGASTFTFGGHLGVGQHFVFNEWSALRVELRDYLYSGQRDLNGVPESHLENQLMLEIGISFFVPLHASEG